MRCRLEGLDVMFRGVGYSVGRFCRERLGWERMFQDIDVICASLLEFGYALESDGSCIGDGPLKTHVSARPPLQPCLPSLPQVSLLPSYYIQLLRPLHPHLHNPQHRIPQLTLHPSNMPLPPLRLLRHLHRHALRRHHPGPTLEQSLVDIPRRLVAPLLLYRVGYWPGGNVGEPRLEGVVPAADHGGAVEPEDVAGVDGGREEEGES